MINKNIFSKLSSRADFNQLWLHSDRERFVAGVLLFSLLLFCSLSMYADLAIGAAWSHVGTETAVIFLSVTGFVLLWKNSVSTLRRRTLSLEATLQDANDNIKHWQNQAADLIYNFSSGVSKQFSRWHFSAAERNVAIFLLKGLSHKEIADLRNTSEKTVRQQAAALYQKAQVEGRAELAAFFLHDLLQSSREAA